MKYFKKITLTSKIVFILWTLYALCMLFSGEAGIGFAQWLVIWIFGCLLFVGIAQFLSEKRKKNQSAIDLAQGHMQRATQLANTINITCNFEEFVNSYRELIKNMEFLQSIENLSFSNGKNPSKELAEIREKRSLTEKNFVDRYLFKNVEVTQGSGDHGIDILAEKDGITYAIQCKCYSSNIGNSAVQQAHTGKSLYHKDIAVVLTNRYFTPQAKQEAQALGVKLWDRDKLNSMIEKANS